jgi:hypothetical protein
MRPFLVLMFVVFGFQQASAQVIKPGAPHFKSTGTIDSFQWAPETYSDAQHPNPFRYDIFYYIPESIRDQTQASAVIFNHGGGDSTLTREGSLRVVGLYINDLKRIADDLGVVVVLPSANGLNWGGHTVTLMKNLAALMRKELNIDPNRLGLSGHSMGGMGITRSYGQLADEFSFFLPLSAGMALPEVSNDASDWHLSKLFNVPYTHIQGLADSFDIFVTRGLEQVKRTQALAAKYGIASKLQMIFTNTTHNYDLSTFEFYMKQSFKKPRDLYQKELFGTISTGPMTMAQENHITFSSKPVSRYFWVQAVENQVFDYDSVNFHAKIEDNQISIDLPKLPVRFHQLNLFLHSKMVNLNAPVKVLVNGVLAAIRYPGMSNRSLRSRSPVDPGFVYEDSMVINLPTGPQMFNPYPVAVNPR